jgi:ABC-type sugar transport system permease subunit
MTYSYSMSSLLTNVLVVLVVWFALSIPVGLAAGQFLALSSPPEHRR